MIHFLIIWNTLFIETLYYSKRKDFGDYIFLSHQEGKAEKKVSIT